MIGIFIGIATVVSLIALGAGLKTAISSQFSTLGTDRLVIQTKGAFFGPPGQGAAAELTKKDVDVVQRSSYVTLAIGRMIEPTQAEFNGKRKVVIMASLPTDSKQRELAMSVMNVKPEAGRYPKKGDGFRVAIGSDYSTADKFGKPVRVGDNLIIQGKKVEVIGVMAKRGTPQFDSAIIMNEDSLRELLSIPERYSVIAAQVTSTEDIDLAKQAIEKNLRSSRGVKERKEDFTVQTPEAMLATFDTIIGGVTAVLVGIAGISLVVGGIGIMNTMYTSVLERTREIGVMKAVGARNEDVLAIFLFESGLLGLTGGLIGVLLGAFFSKIVVFFGSLVIGPGLLQTNLSLPLILGALAFSFVVGALAGTLPAYEASKLPPVEALGR